MQDNDTTTTDAPPAQAYLVAYEIGEHGELGRVLAERELSETDYWAGIVGFVQTVQDAQDLAWMVRVHTGATPAGKLLGEARNRPPAPIGEGEGEWSELVANDGARMWVRPQPDVLRPHRLDASALPVKVRKMLRDELVRRAEDLYPEGKHASLDRSIEDLHDLDGDRFTIEAQKAKEGMNFWAEIMRATEHAQNVHHKTFWYEDDCARLHVLRCAAVYVANYLTLSLEG